MKAKLIAFVPFEKQTRHQTIEKNETNHLVNGAWRFAYSAVWQHQIVHPKKLHHQNDERLTTTLTCYQQLVAKRQQSVDFRKDLQIVTDCYLQYVLSSIERMPK